MRSVDTLSFYAMLLLAISEFRFLGPLGGLASAVGLTEIVGPSREPMLCFS